MPKQTPPASSLCLDTGHHAYRGGDPVAFFLKHHARIPYLHLKSVDRQKQEWVERERIPFAIAVGNDMFCEPHTGAVDFIAFRDALRKVDYDGWATVEQDMYPAAVRQAVSNRQENARVPSFDRAGHESRLMSELNVQPELDSAAGWEASPARPSHVRYQVLGFACALAVVTYIQRIGFAVGAPAIADDLGLDQAQVSLLMSAFLLAYGAFQVPGGLLGDRKGGRRVLTILVLGWSLLTGAVALAALLPRGPMLALVFLLVLRFAFGMFQAGGFPTVGRVIADWMPLAERGSAQGLIWMFSRWGAALIPFLLVWLFRVCHGWPIPFLLIAALGFVWCGAFWPWFRDHPGEMVQVNRAELKIIESGRTKAHGPGCACAMAQDGGLALASGRSA